MSDLFADFDRAIAVQKTPDELGVEALNGVVSIVPDSLRPFLSGVTTEDLVTEMKRGGFECDEDGGNVQGDRMQPLVLNLLMAACKSPHARKFLDGDQGILKSCHELMDLRRVATMADQESPDRMRFFQSIREERDLIEDRVQTKMRLEGFEKGRSSNHSESSSVTGISLGFEPLESEVGLSGAWRTETATSVSSDTVTRESPLPFTEQEAARMRELVCDHEFTRQFSDRWNTAIETFGYAVSNLKSFFKERGMDDRCAEMFAMTILKGVINTFLENYPV